MAEKSCGRRIVTVPNMLSLLRILLIPVYTGLYLAADGADDRSRFYYASAAVMAFSMATDALDGFIARRFDLITPLGKALDPVADKLTQGSILVCLIIHYKKHPQFLIMAAIFVAKELFMLVMGIVNLRKGRMLNGALKAGKVCTTVLFVGMVLFVIFPKMSGGWIWTLSALCSVAMLVSLGFYASTYCGGKHGVEIVEIEKRRS